MIRRVMLTLCVSTLLASAAPAKEPVVKLFDVYARVDVDAKGAIADVQAQGNFPPAIADAIVANARRLKFSAPVVDGRATAARTFVQMQACTQKVGDTYQLSTRFRGQGPMRTEQTFPRYPSDAERRGVGARFDLVIQVNPDGSASMPEVHRLDGSKQFDAEFRHALADWAGALHYQPESLDGAPVATRVRSNVQFVLAFYGHMHNDPGNAKDCQAAFARADKLDTPDSALDSPTRVSQ